MHHICIKYRANWKMPRYSLFWCNRQENNELSQWGIPKTPHLYLTYISLDTSLLSWWNKWGLSEIYQTYLTRLYRPIHRGWSLIKWVSEVKSVKVWIKKNSSNIISSDEFINIFTLHLLQLCEVAGAEFFCYVGDAFLFEGAVFSEPD